MAIYYIGQDSPVDLHTVIFIKEGDTLMLITNEEYYELKLKRENENFDHFINTGEVKDE